MYPCRPAFVVVGQTKNNNKIEIAMHSREPHNTEHPGLNTTHGCEYSQKKGRHCRKDSKYC